MEPTRNFLLGPSTPIFLKAVTRSTESEVTSATATITMCHEATTTRTVETKRKITEIHVNNLTAGTTMTTSWTGDAAWTGVTQNYINWK